MSNKKSDLIENPFGQFPSLDDILEKYKKIQNQLNTAEFLLKDAEISLSLYWPLEAERINNYFKDKEK